MKGLTWTPWALPGLAVFFGGLGLAYFIYRARPDRRQNRLLALQIACEAVTEYQGGFLLSDSANLDILFHYPDFESMGSGGALEAFRVDPQFSRLSTRGDTLFTAWHSTNTVQVEDLPSESAMPSLLLEGFDDWVDGMSATSDGRLYVLSSETIFAFDVTTGEQLLQMGLPTSGTPLTTLHCWTN